jgi:5-methylcytosine-specific restriction endonuclease McrA
MNYTKNNVWEKGHTVQNCDKSQWRKDDAGAWIKYDDYGNTNSIHGWEIDHITSIDHGGEDTLSNVRPLQWQNNRAKSSGRLTKSKWAVTANGTNNVEIGNT